MKIIAILYFPAIFILLSGSLLYASSAGATQDHATWKDFLFSLINFSIIVFLLFYFGRKPVAEFLNKRSKAIEDAIKEAREARDGSKKALAEVEKRFKEKDKEVAEIIEAAKNAGEKERYDLIVDGQKKKSTILEQSNILLEYEIKKAKDAIRKEAVLASLEYAEKELTRRLYSDKDEKLIQESLNKLAEKRWIEFGGIEITKQLKTRKRISKGYAKLFVDRFTTKEAESAIEQLISLSNLIADSSVLETVFKSPIFGRHEREKIIFVLSSKLNLSHKIIDFLVSLNKRDAVQFLDTIIKIALELIEERKESVLTEVIFAKAPKDAILNRIKSILREILKRELEIHITIDPSIIGGLIIKSGSKVYDSSVKGQLQKLKASLLIP